MSVVLVHSEPLPPLSNSSHRSWHRELNRYHWFVLIVAALGWLFDTMDQQLFALARTPAMQELLAPSPGVRPEDGVVAEYAGYATSIFLMGWASGGLFFGVLGDRIGRAKTMMLTILVYSLCTGLSAFSVSFWDFAIYRFLTGLGVGGEFAVGVALVAEAMPERARPFALGLLQALSAVGNISAAVISIMFGELEQMEAFRDWNVFGIQLTAWRLMFVVGTLPALLALVIRRRLKEPEQWQAVRETEAKTKLGSYGELFGDPRWRKNVIVGLLLATSGVIGLWGIGFFSYDLTRLVFRKVFEQEHRDQGEADADRDLVRLAVQNPAALDSLSASIKPNDLLSPTAEHNDAQAVFAAAVRLHQAGESVSPEAVLAALDEDAAKPQSEEDRARRAEYLSGEPAKNDAEAHATRISTRSSQIRGQLTRWAGYTSMMVNLGAFFGIYGFALVTHRIGRRPAFAVSFIAAGLSTVLVFWAMDDVTDVFWMAPLMGLCQLSLFGGYAIYFPELFPTRLRSTGTSFCYNVGRFIAALGPSALGLLTSRVFVDYPEPMRYAGVTMCSIFLLGLLVLPFAPETHGKPLPE